MYVCVVFEILYASNSKLGRVPQFGTGAGESTSDELQALILTTTTYDQRNGHSQTSKQASPRATGLASQHFSLMLTPNNSRLVKKCKEFFFNFLNLLNQNKPK